MIYIIYLFALFGYSVFLFIVLYTLYNIYKGYITFIAKNPINLKEKYGDWAVVTGCTDGIGKAYAKELAARGINIVLISRNITKLNNTAKELESQYKVKTKILVADFSRGQEVFNELKKELENFPVGILVNNVGCQYSYPMYLTEAPEKELWDIINVNIGITTMMTKLVLGQMKERRRGAIVNVSSSSEFQPWPLFTVYSASKVYIKYFSEAIRVEYEKYDITVQHLSPSFVGTKMNQFSHRIDRKSFFVPDAEQYARSAISSLGVSNSTTGYWTHGLQWFFSHIFPVYGRLQIAAYMNQIFRKDYLSQQKEQVIKAAGKME